MEGSASSYATPSVAVPITRSEVDSPPRSGDRGEGPGVAPDMDAVASELFSLLNALHGGMLLQAIVVEPSQGPRSRLVARFYSGSGTVPLNKVLLHCIQGSDSSNATSLISLLLCIFQLCDSGLYPTHMGMGALLCRDTELLRAIAILSFEGIKELQQVLPPSSSPQDTFVALHVADGIFELLRIILSMQSLLDLDDDDDVFSAGPNVDMPDFASEGAMPSGQDQSWTLEQMTAVPQNATAGAHDIDYTRQQQQQLQLQIQEHRQEQQWLLQQQQQLQQQHEQDKHQEQQLHVLQMQNWQQYQQQQEQQQHMQQQHMQQQHMQQQHMQQQHLQQQHLQQQHVQQQHVQQQPSEEQHIQLQLLQEGKHPEQQPYSANGADMGNAAAPVPSCEDMDGSSAVHQHQPNIWQIAQHDGIDDDDKGSHGRAQGKGDANELLPPFTGSSSNGRDDDFSVSAGNDADITSARGEHQQQKQSASAARDRAPAVTQDRAQASTCSVEQSHSVMPECDTFPHLLFSLPTLSSAVAASALMVCRFSGPTEANVQRRLAIEQLAGGHQLCLRAVHHCGVFWAALVRDQRCPSDGIQKLARIVLMQPCAHELLLALFSRSLTWSMASRRVSFGGAMVFPYASRYSSAQELTHHCTALHVIPPTNLHAIGQPVKIYDAAPNNSDVTPTSIVRGQWHYGVIASYSPLTGRHMVIFTEKIPGAVDEHILLHNDMNDFRALDQWKTGDDVGGSGEIPLPTQAVFIAKPSSGNAPTRRHPKMQRYTASTTMRGVFKPHRGMFIRNVPPGRHEWCAAIMESGTLKILGRFETEVQAARAYDRAAKLQFGARACLNFPSGNNSTDEEEVGSCDETDSIDDLTWHDTDGDGMATVNAAGARTEDGMDASHQDANRVQDDNSKDIGDMDDSEGANVPLGTLTDCEDYDGATFRCDPFYWSTTNATTLPSSALLNETRDPFYWQRQKQKLATAAAVQAEHGSCARESLCAVDSASNRHTLVRVSFELQRLGLALRRESEGHIVVLSVGENARALGVREGDCVLKVHDTQITPSMSHHFVSTLIAAAPRPFNIDFSRLVPVPVGDDGCTISGASASDISARYERIWKPEGAGSVAQEAAAKLDATSGRATPNAMSFCTDKAGIWLDLCNAARVRHLEILPTRWADTNTCVRDFTPSNLTLMDIDDLEWHTAWLQMLLSCPLFPSLFATMSVGGRMLGKRAIERAEHGLLRRPFISMQKYGLQPEKLQAAEEFRAHVQHSFQRVIKDNFRPKPIPILNQRWMAQQHRRHYLSGTEKGQEMAARRVLMTIAESMRDTRDPLWMQVQAWDGPEAAGSSNKHMSFKRRLQALAYVSPDVVEHVPATAEGDGTAPAEQQNPYPTQQPTQQPQQCAEDAIQGRDQKRQKLSDDGSGKAAGAGAPSKDYLLELEKSLQGMLNFVPTGTSAFSARASTESPTAAVPATTLATPGAATFIANTAAVPAAAATATAAGEAEATVTDALPTRAPAESPTAAVSATTLLTPGAAILIANTATVPAAAATAPAAGEAEAVHN